MNTDELKNLDAALAKVRAEVIRARGHHPAFASPHEAYAILLEEVDELWEDELWEDIKADRLAPAVAESIQVAAMAVRFLSEFTDSIDDDQN